MMEQTTGHCDQDLGNAGRTNAAEYVSQWKTTEPVSLTAASLMDLLEGRTPLLKQSNFISKELARRVEGELESRFSPYLNDSGTKLDKVGVSQFEFQAQSQEEFMTRSGMEKEEYFAVANSLRDTHKDLGAKVGVNLFESVFRRLASLLPEDWEIELASEGPDRTYYAGIVRGINNGTPIHCDWAPYDTLTESWLIGKVTNQAVFNLYLSDVLEGDTQVHDLQWSPAALEYRDPSSYGYYPELVKGRLKARFHPEAGDLYVFNSRNMHEVFKVDPASKRRRMAMASFFGVLPPLEPGGKTKLIFWS